MRTIKLLILFFALQVSLVAQESTSERKTRIPMINLNASFHTPGGDLEDRFGNSSLFGVGFQLKNKKNFFWGLEIAGLSGSTVIEDDIIDIITAGSVDIINVSGNTASIRFWERGAHAQISFGKIIPIFAPNQNSGFFIQGGFGYMYHKIRIEDIGNNSPQLNSEMLKGYGPLEHGFKYFRIFWLPLFLQQQKNQLFYWSRIYSSIYSRFKAIRLQCTKGLSR